MLPVNSLQDCPLLQTICFYLIKINFQPTYQFQRFLRTWILDRHLNLLQALTGGLDCSLHTPDYYLAWISHHFQLMYLGNFGIFWVSLWFWNVCLDPFEGALSQTKIIACFVFYLKIINTFLKSTMCIF